MNKAHTIGTEFSYPHRPQCCSILHSIVKTVSVSLLGNTHNVRLVEFFKIIFAVCKIYYHSIEIWKKLIYQSAIMSSKSRCFISHKIEHYDWYIHKQIKYRPNIKYVPLPQWDFLWGMQFFSTPVELWSPKNCLKKLHFTLKSHYFQANWGRKELYTVSAWMQPWGFIFI